MARLTRIQCDGKDCPAQIEYYAGEYYMRYAGLHAGDIIPPGWFGLVFREAKTTDSATAVADPSETRYFCSVACVQTFDGGIKGPVHVTGRNWTDKGVALDGLSTCQEGGSD